MDAFGGSSNLSDSTSYKLSNDFNTIPNNDIDNVINSNRVEPRQVATGVTRGTWRINNTDGSYITIGLIPNTDNEFGIAYFQSDNTRIFTIDASGFLFSYNSENRIKIGLKPDSSDIGIYLTPAGTDVIDELSA